MKIEIGKKYAENLKRLEQILGELKLEQETYFFPFRHYV